MKLDPFISRRDAARDRARTRDRDANGDSAARPAASASPAGVFAKVRAHLASTAALRAFIILSFFLYEVPFIRRLVLEEQWLRLPLWDGAFVDHKRTFVL